MHWGVDFAVLHWPIFKARRTEASPPSVLSTACARRLSNATLHAVQKINGIWGGWMVDACLRLIFCRPAKRWQWGIANFIQNHRFGVEGDGIGNGIDKEDIEPIAVTWKKKSFL